MSLNKIVKPKKNKNMAHKKAKGLMFQNTKSKEEESIRKVLEIGKKRLKEKCKLSLRQFNNLGYRLIYRDLSVRLEKRFIFQENEVFFSYIIGEHLTSTQLPQTKQQLYTEEFKRALTYKDSLSL